MRIKMIKKRPTQIKILELSLNSNGFNYQRIGIIRIINGLYYVDPGVSEKGRTK